MFYKLITTLYYKSKCTLTTNLFQFEIIFISEAEIDSKISILAEYLFCNLAPKLLYQFPARQISDVLKPTRNIVDLKYKF